MASHQLLQTRLLNNRESRMEGTSPSRDVFRKTTALFSALKRMGCSAPLQEETTFESDEEDAQNNLSLYRSQNQQGYEPAAPSCDSRLQFNYDYKQSPFICCEHHSKNTNKDHYIKTAIADGSYDIQYLEALFINDEEEIYKIEESAVELGYGPLIECSTVCNFSTQRSICPFDHQDEDGDLLQLQMIHLKCKVVFKIYEPLEEYRMQCPYVLVVVKGVHKHPIPLPVKTPPAVKTEIRELLSQFQEDLPDLTPRRFLRHPLVKAHLAQNFPGLPNPMMSDVHISLSNRAHLKCFIDDIRKATFPSGTGWKGVELLQSQHLIERPLTEQYIRTMVDIDASGFDVHDEDEVEQSQGLSRLKFIVLMGREGSFKRIVGLYEFELAGWDRDAATCRAVQWHHLHGAEPYGDYGRKILQWAGDQHGGQAKGLGLHLQNVAQRLPDVFDLYQQTRLLKDLSPYDHLNRVFRLCVTHAFQNIRKCKVPDVVKALMRSLICIEHVDWDRTIHKIKNLGGKPAEECSKFAFAGMCWAKSFIPRDIWLSGERTSNLIESVHADVNCEGLHCTMVGGVLKGEFFDSLQMKTLKAFEETGIRSSYKTGHPVKNTVKNLKRKFNVYHKTLCADDQRIEDVNSKIHGAHQKIHKAKERIVTAQSALGNPAAYASTYDRRVSTLERVRQSLEKARAAYTKEVGAAKELHSTHVSGTITGYGITKGGGVACASELPHLHLCSPRRRHKAALAPTQANAPICACPLAPANPHPHSPHQDPLACWSHMPMQAPSQNTHPGTSAHSATPAPQALNWMPAPLVHARTDIEPHVHPHPQPKRTLVDLDTLYLCPQAPNWMPAQLVHTRADVELHAYAHLQPKRVFVDLDAPHPHLHPQTLNWMPVPLVHACADIELHAHAHPQPKRAFVDLDTPHPHPCPQVLNWMPAPPVHTHVDVEPHAHAHPQPKHVLVDLDAPHPHPRPQVPNWMPVPPVHACADVEPHAHAHPQPKRAFVDLDAPHPHPHPQVPNWMPVPLVHACTDIELHTHAHLQPKRPAPTPVSAPTPPMHRNGHLCAELHADALSPSTPHVLSHPHQPTGPTGDVGAGHACKTDVEARAGIIMPAPVQAHAQPHQRAHSPTSDAMHKMGTCAHSTASPHTQTRSPTCTRAHPTKAGTAAPHQHCINACARDPAPGTPHTPIRAGEKCGRAWGGVGAQARWGWSALSGTPMSSLHLCAMRSASCTNARVLADLDTPHPHTLNSTTMLRHTRCSSACARVCMQKSAGPPRAIPQQTKGLAFT
ncbi:hypothetical protein C8J57DRAFT_1220907 [Mycena rebaudengoi]|nr:hypothetical protein C8J57DRAFT_1220907 [Mycena rebaudengoi]